MTRLAGVSESVNTQHKELAAAAEGIINISQTEIDGRSLADKVRQKATEAVFVPVNQLPSVALPLIEEQNFTALSNKTKNPHARVISRISGSLRIRL